MARMHALQPKAPVGLIEAKHTAVGDQRDRSAIAKYILRACPRRADEAHFRNQRAARMFGAEQDDLGHDVVEIGRAERPRKTHLRVLILADAHEIDVSFAVDFAAGKEEHVDAALSGAVEQLAPTVGKEIMVS